MFEFLKNQWVGILAIILLVVAMNMGGLNVGGPSDTTSVLNDVVFNQDGHASADFRVESDTNTHALYVDAGNNTVTADGFTYGGTFTTLAQTANTYTLTEAEMIASNGFTFTASTTQPALTLTLPATSTMTTLLASSGDTRQWLVTNPFTGSGTTTTLAAGTGIDLQEPDGQNVVIGITNYAYLTCTRMPSTNVVCKVDETIPAD
jgi:hypothetical protein